MTIIWGDLIFLNSPVIYINFYKINYPLRRSPLDNMTKSEEKLSLWYNLFFALKTSTPFLAKLPHKSNAAWYWSWSDHLPPPIPHPAISLRKVMQQAHRFINLMGEAKSSRLCKIHNHLKKYLFYWTLFNTFVLSIKIRSCKWKSYFP